MKRPFVSLTLLALLCGALWRAELEWRWGWASLAWAWKFYAAFPLGIACFVAWVVRITRVRETAKFAASLVVFFVCALEFFWFYLRYAGVAWIDPSPDSLIFTIWMLPVFWALLPLAFGWVCRYFGVRVHFGLHLLSSVLFIVSWPLAVWLLDIVDHRGGANLIHALKSGFVIPLLVFSLGFPLLFVRRGDGSPSSPA